jgi:hypothetical protein
MTRTKCLPLALLFVVAVAGCANRMQEAFYVRSAFNASYKEVIDLRKQNVIPDEQYKIVVGAADVTEPVLDELDIAATSNNPFNWSRAYDNAQAKLRDFLTAATTAKRTKK